MVTPMILLQAIANESGINFISVKGPELLNMVPLPTYQPSTRDPTPLSLSM